MKQLPARVVRLLAAAAGPVAASAALAPASAYGQNISAPATLQLFEASYKTIERRAPDIFMAGYGALWTPPPGRAEQGNLSVGYDVYDRFDLGSAGNYTMYGSELGLKTTIGEVHKIGANVYTDLVWNHNGFADLGTDGFTQSGAYPGFILPKPADANGQGGDIDGDFHGGFEGGDFKGRISNLIDIAHSKNHQYIRNPVPGYANNLPPGESSEYASGFRVANVATESNRRFYPDLQGASETINGVTYHRWNSANPYTGDPVAENATGYLMRHTRWMIDEIGVDGFRLDATKHFVQRFNDDGTPHGNPDWILEYYDVAANAGTKQPLLDGSRKRVFAFGEYLDANVSLAQLSIKKDANANRDALDFAMHYALKANLSDNGFNNSWYGIVENTQDAGDGAANDGSQGVSFDRSHDDGGAHLSNVANAYLLMRPGNSVIYMNAEEFGTNRDFPADGNGDALGGVHGKAIPTLVGIRNTHGRGNYAERWIDKETLVFERDKSAIAGYNNRLDDGYDERTVQTNFAPGTKLVELTGNAADGAIDAAQPASGDGGDLHDMVTVNNSGQITFRIPRNQTDGNNHGKGYVIYGPATPKGSLAVTNVARTIPGDTPTAATNGTARLTAIDVIRSDTFQVQLNTVPVVLPDGSGDAHANGDNAILKFDGGIDVNGNGVVDITAPTLQDTNFPLDPSKRVMNTITYGFENFATKSSPLFGGGDGQFRQTVDATHLSEGYHYVTARAFRHRDAGTGGDGGPAVFSDFKKVIYVDRFRPPVEIAQLKPFGVDDVDVIVRSLDKTATGVHVFHNLGANQFTIDQLVDMAASGQGGSGEYDRDLFKHGLFNLADGNHAFTVVTFEVSYDHTPGQRYAAGGVSVQRFVGVPWAVSGGTGGAGLGDVNHDNVFSPTDPSLLGNLLASNNTSYNPSADLNADGLIDEADNVLNVPWLASKNANLGTIATATNLRLQRALALDGTLHVPGGTLDVSGAPVASVPISFNQSFNITTGKTVTKTGAQAMHVNGTQSHGANATLVTAEGATHLNTDGGANLTVNTTGATASTHFGVTQHLRGVNVSAGGSAQLTTSSAPTVNGGKVLVTKSLGVNGGKLNLNNHNAVVDYAGPSALGAWTGTGYDGVTGMLADGRAGGTWNGATGITSASAATTNGLTTLAVGEASHVLGITGAQTATWRGQTVDATSVLVAYTYGGDADLNGAIDSDDYFAIDSHFNLSGSVFGYHVGDFDLSGAIDSDDYFIIDSNFNVAQAGGAMVPSAADLAAGAWSPAAAASVAAVPEPASAGVLALAALGFACRRRARHNLTSARGS